MSTVISIENISKKFGDITAVNDVSLDVQDGEFLALLGPSGCGKTTLLRMLGGFDYPSNGRILMDGNDITTLPPNKRPLNMVFQSYAVFPHMTVRDNIAYGLKIVGVDKTEINRRVDESLDLVHLTDYAKRMPDKLSGGQRQRVALARALVKRPRVLLLDEPLSALDAKLREIMQVELVKLQRNVGITFVIVTHDQDEALSMAGRIAVMNKGNILQLDAPQTLYEQPNCRFVADFIGRMNIFPCVIKSNGDGVCTISADGIGNISGVHASAELNNGDNAYFSVRPEKLSFSATATNNDICCRTTLEGVSYYGDETVLQCRTDAGENVMCSTSNDGQQALPTPGDTCYLSWKADDIIVLKN